jgi:hypothetical protein
VSRRIQRIPHEPEGRFVIKVLVSFVRERPPDWADHHGADAREAGGLAADG